MVFGGALVEELLLLSWQSGGVAVVTVFPVPQA